MGFYSSIWAVLEVSRLQSTLFFALALVGWTISHQDAGVQLSNEGSWEFDEAIQLNPKGSLAYYNPANAYRNLGDYHLAIRDYEQVLGLDPRDALAYNSRADAYYNLGEYHLAFRTTMKPSASSRN